MNSKRQLSFLRFLWVEPNCTFRILNSWIRVIMLFIESTRNTCSLRRKTKLIRHCLQCFYQWGSSLKGPIRKVSRSMLHWFGQIEETKSPLCGTLSGIDRILPLYLKCVSIERQRGMVLAATLETHLVVSRKKIRKHRRNFNNEKIFPSPNTTTTRLISSVIITIMGLRNIRSLIIWWKCLWDMDRTLKEGSMDYTSSPKCMRLVYQTLFLTERD